MEKYTLKNGIQALIKRNNNTPRSAFVMYSKLNKDEEKAGLYYLITQLLFQGTKTKTAEELATVLDENAIDFTIEKKVDYLRFKVQCLNEDLNTSLALFEDIINNSTFNDFEKEILKIKGEFEADLDSARIQAQDNFYRTIFKNHPYGTGRKEILEQIDSITKDDIVDLWNDIKYSTMKNIVVIGDVEEKEVEELLEKHLNFLEIKETKLKRQDVKPLTENVVSVIEKEDANQAQIFQGWQVPSIYDEEYPAILLLNTMLGASGLSSRLFLELREKKGLAYTVRSVYEPYRLSADFFVYIATEPKNITTCIQGFENEMKKIMTEIITDEELANAKNSTIGKRQFNKETNLLEASLKGYYEYLNLDYTFEEKLFERINAVTKETILKTAEKCFSTPNALCVLAPKKYLKDAKLM